MHSSQERRICVPPRVSAFLILFPVRLIAFVFFCRLIQMIHASLAHVFSRFLSVHLCQPFLQIMFFFVICFLSIIVSSSFIAITRSCHLCLFYSILYHAFSFLSRSPLSPPSIIIIFWIAPCKRWWMSAFLFAFKSLQCFASRLSGWEGFFFSYYFFFSICSCFS